MIGSVAIILPDGDGRAVLHEDRTWTFEGAPAAVEHLRYGVMTLDVEDEGPADGPFGARRLHALAGLVKGVIEFEEKIKPPPGTIY